MDNFSDKDKQVRLSLSKKAIYIVLLPFIAQIFILVQYGGALVQRVEFLAGRQYYSKAVLNQVNWICLLLSLATNGVTAFAVTGDHYFSDVVDKCLDAIPARLKELDGVIDKNGPQAKDLHGFSRATQEQTRSLSSLLKMAKLRQSKSVLNRLTESNSKNLYTEIFHYRHRLLASDSFAEINDREALPAARRTQKFLLILILVANLSGAGLLIYLFNRQVGKKLKILSENALLLGSHQPLPPPLFGSDEIAYLDQTLHKASEELREAEKYLKASEARLRQVIENMPVGLLTIKEGGYLNSANAEVQKLFGLNEDKLIGKRLSELLPDNALDDELSADIETREIELRISDEQVFVLEYSRRHYPFSTGNLDLVALHDVTARRDLERMRQDFLNMVSHDLRSPLTSMRLFLNLLAKGAYGALNSAGTDNLSRAERNVDRLLGMINDLLDFEKMQAGHISLDIEPLDVDALIASACELLLGLAERNHIKIEMVPSKIWLMGDRERLVQVLANLLSNAIKFSSSGQTVRVEAQAVSMKEVEVRVSDQGRGVPAEKIDLIFDKFKQAEKLDGKGNRGIGLGLPICKWIIEQHAGTLGVESQIGAGSTFWFRLKRIELKDL